MIGQRSSRPSSAAPRAASEPGRAAAIGARPDVAAAFRHCEAIVRAHPENFPVASRLVARELRPHVAALYAFARTADDIADEPRHEGHRAEELDRWEDRLLRCYHGEVDHPVFVALAATVERFDLPITPFQDLLAAFRLDLERRRHSTWQDLLGYTALAARPIGRLLLYLSGLRDPERHRFADELSTALALTSFWQDIARDAARDRVYVPLEDLAHFGVAEADLRARRDGPALADLVRFECARTRAVYLRARPLLARLDGALALETALVWHRGERALARVEARAGAVFGPRPELGALDRARALAAALAGHAAPAIRRAARRAGDRARRRTGVAAAPDRP